MPIPVIDWQICQSCQPCQARRICRTRAIIKPENDEPAYIEPSRCTGCLKCLPACEWAAIRLDNHRLA